MKNTFEGAKLCNTDCKIYLIFQQPQNDNNNSNPTQNINLLINNKQLINQTLHTAQKEVLISSRIFFIELDQHNLYLIPMLPLFSIPLKSVQQAAHIWCGASAPMVLTNDTTCTKQLCLERRQPTEVLIIRRRPLISEDSHLTSY